MHPFHSTVFVPLYSPFLQTRKQSSRARQELFGHYTTHHFRAIPRHAAVHDKLGRFTRVWINTQCTIIVVMSWNRQDSWVECMATRRDWSVAIQKAVVTMGVTCACILACIYCVIYHLRSKVSVPKPPQPCSWQTMIYMMHGKVRDDACMHARRLGTTSKNAYNTTQHNHDIVFSTYKSSKQGCSR
jgi:hypothetical protein